MSSSPYISFSTDAILFFVNSMSYVRRTRRTRVPEGSVVLQGAPRRTRSTRSAASRPGPLRALGTKWSNPLPQNAFYRFRYIDNGFLATLNAVNGFRYFYRFTGNGPYDPDNTGAGVQPYGWDQVAALFPTGAYRVLGSSCTVNFAIKGTTGSQVKVYLIPSRSATLSYNDVSDLRSVPFARYRVIDKAAGLSNRNWLKSYVSTGTLRKSFTTTDAAWGSTWTSNPTLMWYWHVYIDSADAAEDVSVVFDVEIVYYTAVSRVDDVNES